ncbi:MAG: helix-turn-helix domain-containing protein [Pyrinomonadaceae bacterium]
MTMLKVYKPRNAELRKHIECFYVYTRDADDDPVRYLTFPSIFTLVSISKDSLTTETELGLRTEYCAGNPIEANLVCAFNKPVCIEYSGQIDEITIYFKPLGINAFLPDDLCVYNTGQYADFDPFGDLKSRMKAILTQADVEKRLSDLETYWLSKLVGFDHPLLENVIGEMFADDGESIPVAQLARKYGVSRSTLNNHFARHICKSPSEMRKVIRFRRAMQDRYVARDRKRLTDITYGLNYFDQSHMIKDFRSLTGYSPAKFFSSISELENGQINWLFL